METLLAKNLFREGWNYWASRVRKHKEVSDREPADFDDKPTALREWWYHGCANALLVYGCSRDNKEALQRAEWEYRKWYPEHKDAWPDELEPPIEVPAEIFTKAADAIERAFPEIERGRLNAVISDWLDDQTGGEWIRASESAENVLNGGIR